MSEVQQILGAAVLYHRDGRLDEALALYRQVLARDPENARAHGMIGAIAMAKGDPAGAVAAFEQAVSANPSDARMLNNLAAACRAHGDRRRAEAVYRQALAADPGLISAAYNLGNLLAEAGDREAAAEAFRQVLARQPGHVEAGNNLALSLLALGRLDAAASVLEGVLAAAPDHPLALANLGIVRLEQGQAEAAVTALQASLARQPGSAPALEALGNALRRLGDEASAAAAYSRAERLSPRPGLAVKRRLILPAIPASVAAMDEARTHFALAVEEMLADPPRLSDPLAEVGATNFHLSYHDADNRLLQRRVAAMYLAACPGLNWEAPHCAVRDRPADRRLRIGFVSRHLREHAIGRCFAGMIRHLPRERLHVTVVTPVAASDPLAHDIHASADAVLHLPQRLDLARQALAEARFDALVYTDIGMEPLTYFLAFARLAPFQAVLWGHPDTTGIPGIDAFVTYDSPDALAAAEFSEPVVAFPGFPTHYRRPEPPDPARDRAALGLPAAAHLYFCAQTLFKVHPDMDALFRAILEADAEGLLLLPAGGTPHLAQQLDARLQHTLGSAHRRVRFLPPLSHGDFMAVLAAADVSLDTRPFGGGNTSLQALSVGTPVVNWPAPWLRGRFTRRMYEHIGIGDCTVGDAAAYVATAVDLARHAERRADLSQRIEAGSGALFGDA
ncbi:MAG: tetratricopeptide repeat protein, partial [Alphaproteobacteria bacterium]